jgi:hypothetical protein
METPSLSRHPTHTPFAEGGVDTTHVFRYATLELLVPVLTHRMMSGSLRRHKRQDRLSVMFKPTTRTLTLPFCQRLGCPGSIAD